MCMFGLSNAIVVVNFIRDYMFEDLLFLFYLPSANTLMLSTAVLFLIYFLLNVFFVFFVGFKRDLFTTL